MSLSLRGSKVLSIRSHAEHGNEVTGAEHGNEESLVLRTFVPLFLRGSKEHSIRSHAEHGNEVTGAERRGEVFLVVRTLHLSVPTQSMGTRATSAERGYEVWKAFSSVRY